MGAVALDTPTQELVLRLVIAGVLGSLVGLEREFHGRPAGFRTHLLVAVGSALFAIISFRATAYANGFVDPARIAAQVVTGMGFIGAGVVFKSGLGVRGLTTAASLWMSSAIGLGTGFGEYTLAAATTLIALTALILFRVVERALPKERYMKLVVVLDETNERARKRVVETIDGAVRWNQLQKANRDKDARETQLLFDVMDYRDESVSALAGNLAVIEGVISVDVHR